MMTEALPTETPDAVDNSRMWLLVAAPVLIFVINAALLYSGHSDSNGVSIGIALAVTIALAMWDEHYLKSQGHFIGGTAGWLVPAYLWQRSKHLGQSQAPMVLWLAAFGVSVAAGIALDSHFVTVDPTSVEQQLTTWTNQQGGESGASVTCPSKTTYAVGSTFVCDVSDASTSAHLLVKVVNGDGYLSWQIVP